MSTEDSHLNQIKVEIKKRLVNSCLFCACILTVLIWFNVSSVSFVQVILFMPGIIIGGWSAMTGKSPANPNTIPGIDSSKIDKKVDGYIAMLDRSSLKFAIGLQLTIVLVALILILRHGEFLNGNTAILAVINFVSSIGLSRYLCWISIYFWAYFSEIE